MTSDETIERAADAVWAAIDDKGIRGRLYREDCNYLVRALAEEGLLAPAPLREEWGVECLDWNGEPRYDRYDQRVGAERMCWEGDRVVRRYVTDWETP